MILNCLPVINRLLNLGNEQKDYASKFNLKEAVLPLHPKRLLLPQAPFCLSQGNLRNGGGNR